MEARVRIRGLSTASDVGIPGGLNAPALALRIRRKLLPPDFGLAQSWLVAIWAVNQQTEVLIHSLTVTVPSKKIVSNLLTMK